MSSYVVGNPPGGHESVRPEETPSSESATARAESEAQGEKNDESHGKPGVESQVPRLPSRPKMPSKQEREEHVEATSHACYRSWCEHCVAARARGQYHRGDGEAGELPEIAFDYGFMA